VQGYVAEEVGGGSRTDLPCAGASPAFVEPLPGPAVAYGCGTDLDVLSLGGAAQPRVYKWVRFAQDQMGPLLFSVDPTQSLVAITHADGTVNAYKLADGTPLPGTYQAGSPAGMAWSTNGILAIASSQGVTVWQPGVAVHTAAAAAYADILRWLPDNSGVVAISSFRPAVLPPGFVIRPDGSARQIVTPQTSHLLYGWTADGTRYWAGPAGVHAGPDTLTAEAWASPQN